MVPNIVTNTVEQKQYRHVAGRGLLRARSPATTCAVPVSSMTLYVVHRRQQNRANKTTRAHENGNREGE